MAIASGLERLSVRLPLVAVDGLPARGKPAIGPFAAQGGAAHVLALAPLHLDDVGAEQCELIARIGAGQHLREVEDFYSFERSGHVYLCETSLRGAKATKPIHSFVT